MQPNMQLNTTKMATKTLVPTGYTLRTKPVPTVFVAMETLEVAIWGAKTLVRPQMEPPTTKITVPTAIKIVTRAARA